MTTFDWRNAIREWSLLRLEMVEDEEKAANTSEVIESEWLGYPGATEAQIKTVESRLGTTLPPSYREFLKVTNGIRSLEEYGIRFYSTEEIDWFCVKNQDWIELWTQGIEETPSVPDEIYFSYGEEQDCVDLRNEYMQTALEISSDYDGYIYLLNPRIITEDGEWEAWDFGNKLVGAHRYRSFRDMMEFLFDNPDMIV